MERRLFVISLLGLGASLSYLIMHFKPLFENALPATYSSIVAPIFTIGLLVFLWASIVILLIYVLSRSKSSKEDETHENNS